MWPSQLLVFMMLLAPIVHGFIYCEQIGVYNYVSLALADCTCHRVASTMSDIQPLLLHYDMLSVAQEALYHPDISFSNQLQNALLLIEDKGPVELPEEFVVQVPKEHRLQPKRTYYKVIFCIQETGRRCIVTLGMKIFPNSQDDFHPEMSFSLCRIVTEVCTTQNSDDIILWDTDKTTISVYPQGAINKLQRPVT